MACARRQLLARNAEEAMAYFLVVIVIGMLIYAMVKIASSKGYSEMTSQEFEAEAKRGSRMGSATAALQKIIDPGHHVEYVQEQKEAVRADGAESGDHPQTGVATESAEEHKGLASQTHT